MSYNLFFLKKETQLGNFGVELEKVSMMKIIVYVHEISREIEIYISKEEKRDSEAVMCLIA